MMKIPNPLCIIMLALFAATLNSGCAALRDRHADEPDQEPAPVATAVPTPIVVAPASPALEDLTELAQQLIADTKRTEPERQAVISDISARVGKANHYGARDKLRIAWLLSQSDKLPDIQKAIDLLSVIRKDSTADANYRNIAVILDVQLSARYELMEKINRLIELEAKRAGR
jgi:hypothetical protein